MLRPRTAASQLRAVPQPATEYHSIAWNCAAQQLTALCARYMLGACEGRAMAMFLLVAVLALLGTSLGHAAEKAPLVVATIEFTDQDLWSQNRLSGPGSPASSDPLLEEGRQRRLIIADPQLSRVPVPVFHGILSFLVRNDTPWEIVSGRLLMRGYLDEKANVTKSDPVTVHFKVPPGSWAQASVNLREKLMAFDLLVVECFFADASRWIPSQFSVPTLRFVHRFEPRDAKRIITRSYGKAKVE